MRCNKRSISIAIPDDYYIMMSFAVDFFFYRVAPSPCCGHVVVSTTAALLFFGPFMVHVSFVDTLAEFWALSSLVSSVGSLT